MISEEVHHPHPDLDLTASLPVSLTGECNFSCEKVKQRVCMPAGLNLTAKHVRILVAIHDGFADSSYERMRVIAESFRAHEAEVEIQIIPTVSPASQAAKVDAKSEAVSRVFLTVFADEIAYATFQRLHQEKSLPSEISVDSCLTSVLCRPELSDVVFDCSSFYGSTNAEEDVAATTDRKSLSAMTDETSSETDESSAGEEDDDDAGFVCEPEVQLDDCESTLPFSWTPTQESNARRNGGGRITLVGAGPGSAELLTVAALRAIRSADIVVSDRLVPEEVRQLARGRVFVARKVPGCAAEAQAELDRVVLEAAEEGLNVVRLKNGDPFVFGRGGEEILTYRERGFDASVIPGISSSTSAALLAGIPITMRGVASQFVVATGHGKNDSLVDVPPYDPCRTTVMLMSVGRVSLIAKSLGEKGFPVNTPVAFIEKASTTAQRLTTTDIAGMVRTVEEQGVKSPAVIVIGNVVGALNTSQSVSSAPSPSRSLPVEV